MIHRTALPRLPHKLFLGGIFALALLLPQRSVFALLNIDGTRNQVFVFGNFTVGYDSNIFASAVPQGDMIYTLSVGTELKRRAGIISVNARAVMDYQKFGKLSDQDSWNPTLYLELNKTTGRTTGALTINAYRSSRADSAVNLRTQTWNFPIGLNIKYPINDKFYVTSASSYLRRSYVDTTQLLSYTDYAQALDLFYVFTSKLDLFASYRIRVGQTERDSTFDHYLSIGADGGILAKLRGNIRAGVQSRQIDASGESFEQFNLTATLFWSVNRKLTISTSIASDFTTTAIGDSVDTFSAQLRATYVFTRRFYIEPGVGYGRNRFLNGAQAGRRDDFFTADIGAFFTFNEHFRVGASYNYLKNWSTLSSSDFERSGYSLDLRTRF